MDLLLTSFGIESAILYSHDRPVNWARNEVMHGGYDIRHILSKLSSRLQFSFDNFGLGFDRQNPLLKLLSQENSANPFHRMIPVSMASVQGAFQPEYEVLFLYDRVTIDETSWDLLDQLPQSDPYQPVAKTFQLLHKEGFVKLVNYQSILSEAKTEVENRTADDIRKLSIWLKPLGEAIDRWSNFENLISRDPSLRKGLIHDFDATQQAYHNLYTELLKQSADLAIVKGLRELIKLKQKAWTVRERAMILLVVQDYLDYVNTNLLLSQKLGAGIQDWEDFLPFYRAKARITPDQESGIKEQALIKQLFSVAFPQYRHWTPKSLVSAITDRRIVELRAMVRSTVAEGGEFNAEFAQATLAEVLSIEENVGRLKNIASYATMPLGFIPVIGTPIEKLADLAIGKVIETKSRSRIPWFYVISEHAPRQCLHPTQKQHSRALSPLD